MQYKIVDRDIISADLLFRFDLNMMQAPCYESRQRIRHPIFTTSPAPPPIFFDQGLETFKPECIVCHMTLLIAEDHISRNIQANISCLCQMKDRSG